MSEYTGLDVSRRLAMAGFVGSFDRYKWQDGEDPHVDEHSDWAKDRYNAYRSDVLLADLVGENYQVAVGHSYDKKHYVAFYTNEKGEHNTKRKLADTITDALGEVILQVMAKEIPYSKHLRDSVTDIINGEDIDPTPD